MLLCMGMPSQGIRIPQTTNESFVGKDSTVSRLDGFSFERRLCCGCHVPEGTANPDYPCPAPQGSPDPAQDTGPCVRDKQFTFMI